MSNTLNKKKKDIIKKVTDFRETGDHVMHKNLALISLIAEELTPVITNGQGLTHDQLLLLFTKMKPLMQENTEAIQAYLDSLSRDYTDALHELSILEVKNG